MKILQLISGGDSGGAKTHVLSLLQDLSRDNEVTLVCFMEGPFADEARERGIETMVLTGGFFGSLTILRAMVQTVRFDLIHCHGSRGNLMGALLRRAAKCPVMTTVHSDYKLDYLGRRAAALVYGTLNRWALGRMDYETCVSDAMRSLLISRGFDPNRMFSIYNGMDFSVQLPRVDRAAYFAEYGLDWGDDCVVAGIAARMDAVKDLSTLLRGFAAAGKGCPGLRLMIAGDGREMPMLRALAEELGVSGRVCFAGWLKDVNRFYAALDINTLTSLSETFPYAVTEGARAHLATVSSRVGGIPALIRHGETGLLFEPGDAAALGRALETLYHDAPLRRRLGEALYEKASREFSLEATGARQREIYAEILRRRQQPRCGVVICGAYGHGNAGDEAILEAIVQQLQSIGRDMPITVLSRSPKQTRALRAVGAVHHFALPAMHRAMRHAALYLNGGGSLIQNVTSRRSLYYYLYTIRTAHRCGCAVQMYGCGIGPVRHASDRRRVARVINACVDAVTLRERHSAQELRACGVTVPPLIEAADPALTLRPADAGRVEAWMTAAGLQPDGGYVCFCVRPWKGFAERAEAFAAAAQHAWQRHGLTPVFLPVNGRVDPDAARLVTSRLTCPHVLLPQPGDGALAAGVMARMRAVVSMRLHGLIFAAGQCVPTVGVSYDPKVAAFMQTLGEGWTPLEEVSDAALSALLDAALDEDRDALAARTAAILALEHRNAETARRLLQGGTPEAG